MMKREWLSVCAAALVVALAGCGTPDETGTPGASAPVSAPESALESAAESSAESRSGNSVASGKKLTVGEVDPSVAAAAEVPYVCAILTPEVAQSFGFDGEGVPMGNGRGLGSCTYEDGQGNGIKLTITAGVKGTTTVPEKLTAVDSHSPGVEAGSIRGEDGTISAMATVGTTQGEATAFVTRAGSADAARNAEADAVALLEEVVE